MNFVTELKKEWIEKGLTDSKGLDYLDKFGLALCDKGQSNDKLGFDAMTTSQVRNIFTEIKRLQAKLEQGKTTQEADKDKAAWQRIQVEFNLLRPKVAYNAARELAKRRNSKIKLFRDVFDKAHNVVNEADTPIQAFKHFCQFFEAVIAYHKVHGGRD